MSSLRFLTLPCAILLGLSHAEAGEGRDRDTNAVRPPGEEILFIASVDEKE